MVLSLLLHWSVVGPWRTLQICVQNWVNSICHIDKNKPIARMRSHTICMRKEKVTQHRRKAKNVPHISQLKSDDETMPPITEHNVNESHTLDVFTSQRTIWGVNDTPSIIDSEQHSKQFSFTKCGCKRICGQWSLIAVSKQITLIDRYYWLSLTFGFCCQLCRLRCEPYPPNSIWTAFHLLLISSACSVSASSFSFNFWPLPSQNNPQKVIVFCFFVVECIQRSELNIFTAFHTEARFCVDCLLFLCWVTRKWKVSSA